MLKNLSLLTVTVAVSLVLCDVLLQIFTPFPISTATHRVADPVLGYRLASEFKGVDGNGFRNPSGLADEYRIAAIGDSHTYGNNVESRDSWPAKFAAITGLATYNFGVGGYNIFSYHSLVKRAFERGVGGVIVALYPANDFNMKATAFCSIDWASEFWTRETKRLGLVYEACADGGDADLGKMSLARSIRLFLSGHSAIISIFDTFVWQRYFTGEIVALPDGFGDLLVSQVKQHSKYTSLEAPEVKQMQESFRALVDDWKQSSSKNGTSFGILVVSSREAVTYRALSDAGLLDVLDVRLRKSIEPQVALEREIDRMLTAMEVPHASILQEMSLALRQAAQDGAELYPPAESHPAALGYGIYAQVAQELWLEMQARAKQ